MYSLENLIASVHSMQAKKHARGKEVAAAATNKLFLEVPPSNIIFRRRLKVKLCTFKGCTNRARGNEGVCVRMGKKNPGQ